MDQEIVPAKEEAGTTSTLILHLLYTDLLMIGKCKNKTHKDHHLVTLNIFNENS